jgi:hypothetical protein
MAKLHITELAGYGQTAKDADVQSIPSDVLAVQAVSIGSSSTASSAFNVNTSLLYVVAGASCAIAVAASATAVVGGTFIPVGGTLYIAVPPGAGYQIAVITDTL